MEGNKSIQRSDEQRNLYKALVDAYEADKLNLDSYGETGILKRRRDDDDKDEGPSTRSDRGSKRWREGKEPELASAPLETTTRSACSCPRKHSNMDKRTGKASESRSSFNELLDTSLDFSNFIMNRFRVDTLTLEILAGPTFELMKGSCTSLIELEYHLEEVYKATTDQLDWVNPEDTYRSDLKRREAYTAYSNPRAFTKTRTKKRLMRIDELHKFSDRTLNDVRNALDDHLKGIRMQCLPQTIWRKSDKDRAAAMIQAIDKMLKTRRIMRSLEKFVGGRLYKGDFRMLQRTI
nr:hypothetical protein [Tanacetum cinerariifolium]